MRTFYCWDDINEAPETNNGQFTVNSNTPAHAAELFATDEMEDSVDFFNVAVRELGQEEILVFTVEREVRFRAYRNAIREASRESSKESSNA